MNEFFTSPEIVKRSPGHEYDDEAERNRLAAEVERKKEECATTGRFLDAMTVTAGKLAARVKELEDKLAAWGETLDGLRRSEGTMAERTWEVRIEELAVPIATEAIAIAARRREGQVGG